MNIYEKYMDETICAIGNIIRYRYTSLITVKKIRDLYNIKSRDGSKTNFYWRCLQSLEQMGILKRYGTKNPRKYQVLNFFKFFELLYEARVNKAIHSENNS
ncbi:MAG: hypothetical protein ACFFDB_02575 [Promethearchaeota archaeon]